MEHSTTWICFCCWLFWSIFLAHSIDAWFMLHVILFDMFIGKWRLLFGASWLMSAGVCANANKSHLNVCSDFEEKATHHETIHYTVCSTHCHRLVANNNRTTLRNGIEPKFQRKGSLAMDKSVPPTLHQINLVNLNVWALFKSLC